MPSQYFHQKSNTWRRKSFFQPLSFSPLQILNLQVWLDAKDLSTLWTTSGKTVQVESDGDLVGYWADKSGNGFDWLQANVPSEARPFWGDGTTASPKSLNGRPAVHTNDLEVSMLDNGDSLLASGNCSVFFAVDTTAIVDVSRLLSFDNDAEKISLYEFATGFNFSNASGEFGGDSNNGWGTEAAIFLITLSQSGNAANTYKNGVASDL